MNRLHPTVTGLALAVPVTLLFVGSVILTRPDNAAPIAPEPTPTIQATTSPTPTPTKTPSPTPTRPATATPRPATLSPAAQGQAVRTLSGVRFGTADVIRNQTGADLPFPGEFALDAHFVLEPDGRMTFFVDSPPFLPSLTGAAAASALSVEGGSGHASGKGRFLGVQTDFAFDFQVNERRLTGVLIIGSSGNLPGGQPLELSISVAEPWN